MKLNVTTKPVLKEKMSSLDALFNSIGDGAIATDEYGKITRVNPVALSILGFDEEELLGQWFPKRIVALNADDHPINLIDRAITKAFLTGEPAFEKIHYRRKDGKSIPVSISTSPIIWKNKPIGAVEVFRDITLEQQVDRMKSEFISLASHQLRTPLSAIKTYSHMLVDGMMGELNSKQKNSLNTIVTATNRMNELISTLLNITRIESGIIAVNPKLLNSKDIINEILPELEIMANHKGVFLQYKYKGSYSLNIKTDPLIVKEVLTNLISNAIKYTPQKGEVSLITTTRRTEIEFQIKDTGWGIPKSSQSQVFSKFFRAPNIIKKETSGTGLGLYLVKGLLDAIGGSIWFESKEGEGTVFFVTIPRKYRFENL